MTARRIAADPWDQRFATSPAPTLFTAAPNGLRLSGDGGEANGVRCSRGLGCARGGTKLLGSQSGAHANRMPVRVSDVAFADVPRHIGGRPRSYHAEPQSKRVDCVDF